MKYMIFKTTDNEKKWYVKEKYEEMNLYDWKMVKMKKKMVRVDNFV